MGEKEAKDLGSNQQGDQMVKTLAQREKNVLLEDVGLDQDAGNEDDGMIEDKVLVECNTMQTNKERSNPRKEESQQHRNKQSLNKAKNVGSGVKKPIITKDSPTRWSSVKSWARKVQTTNYQEVGVDTGRVGSG